MIAFAIAASLIGVAIPLFSGYLHASKVASARRDLTTLAAAVRRWERRNSALLTGGDLGPIVGQTVAALPVDPWGGEYFFDGNLGVLGSFGADGSQGGRDREKDLVLFLREELAVLDATLRPGRFGFVRAGDRLSIQLSKPVEVELGDPDADLADDFDLLPGDPGVAPSSLAFAGFTYEAASSDPALGRLHFRVASEPPPARRIRLGAETRVSLSGFPTWLRERPAAAGDSMILDPWPFLRGSESPVRADGSWSGARVRLR